MDERRAKAAGHLYKRGRIWWVWFYDHSGTLVRRSTGATDKKAAGARLAEWERAAADPHAHAPQTLNDCLQALVIERRRSTGKENGRFLETKVKPLVTLLGGDLTINTIRDITVARRYIEARRSAVVRKAVNDRTILRELRLLVSALRYAKSCGRWSGDLDNLIPPDFKPASAKKGDSITRDQAGRILTRLTADASAAMAFSLATGAEASALRNALREDLPDDLAACRTERVNEFEKVGRRV